MGCDSTLQCAGKKQARSRREVKRVMAERVTCRLETFRERQGVDFFLVPARIYNVVLEAN